jgi:hypothetical protein
MILLCLDEARSFIGLKPGTKRADRRVNAARLSSLELSYERDEREDPADQMRRR